MFFVKCGSVFLVNSSVLHAVQWTRGTNLDTVGRLPLLGRRGAYMEPEDCKSQQQSMHDLRRENSPLLPWTDFDRGSKTIEAFDQKR